MDSTTLKGWSNPGKKGKKPKKNQRRGYTPRTGKVSDPDAGWSVKKNAHGKDEFTWGYKLHLLVDTDSQLPLAASASAGNVHDQKRATNLLSEARFALGSYRAKYVLADRGYSSDPLRRRIQKHYGEPIIDAPRNHKKAWMRARNNPKHRVLRKQRGAVERANSQLKRMHSLNSIRVRGKMKVVAHCQLSVVALQAAYAI